MAALIEAGEKVHVIERRMFESDVRRHFVGTIERVDAGVMRVAGYVFVFDPATSAYVRGAEFRTRLIPLAVSGFVINVLPPDTTIDHVRYVEDAGRLVATDGGPFSLDINEFGRMR